MNCTQHIEIDSTYRNREQWPLPSQFEVLLTQSGQKGYANADDAISNAANITRWTSNAFNTTGPAAVVSGTIDAFDAPGIGASGDTVTVLQITADALNTFQQADNYYAKAVLADTTPAVTASARIISSSYLGTDSGGDDRLQLVIEGALTGVAIGDALEINDPTDLGNPNFPVFFVPAGRPGENTYPGSILYNETRSIAAGAAIYRTITAYDELTHLLQVDAAGAATNVSGSVATWAATDVLSIRKEPPVLATSNNHAGNPSDVVVSLPSTFTDELDRYRNSYVRVLTGAAAGETARVTRYETFSGTAVGGSLSTIEFSTLLASAVVGFYTNAYIQITSGAATGDVRKITAYTDNVASVSPNFSGAVANGDSFVIRSLYLSPTLANTVTSGNVVEILVFSRDNHVPFRYNGSVASQQEFVCYELELINLVLPNKTLNVGHGNRIAFYPYVYVEFSNVNSGASSTYIYSNNPNANGMLFRAVIDDVSNPVISAFVNIDGGGMKQTIKFKPNDNLKFSVKLPNGELFQTLEAETFAPEEPNAEIQISALFSIRRIG